MKNPMSRCARIITAVMLCTALLAPFVAIASNGSVIPKEVGEQFVAAANAAGAGGQEAQLEIVIARIINVSLSLIGVVLVALLVYAGWLWMTAAGEEEKITKAKGIIRSAIIGLIIVFLAYAISRFIIGRLIAATANKAAL